MGLLRSFFRRATLNSPPKSPLVKQMTFVGQNSWARFTGNIRSALAWKVGYKCVVSANTVKSWNFEKFTDRPLLIPAFRRVDIINRLHSSLEKLKIKWLEKSSSFFTEQRCWRTIFFCFINIQWHSHVRTTVHSHGIKGPALLTSEQSFFT